MRYSRRLVFVLVMLVSLLAADLSRTSAQGSGAAHTVQSGDTLSSIAAQYGTTVEALAALNNISYPYRIIPGQVISLPVAGGSSESPPTSATGTPALPSDSTTSTVELCTVQTDRERFATIRSGPGVNRAALSFLPAHRPFPVVGQAAADNGSLWWELDKAEVLPSAAVIGNVWVSMAEVTTAGDCSRFAQNLTIGGVPISLIFYAESYDFNRTPLEPGMVYPVMQFIHVPDVAWMVPWYQDTSQDPLNNEISLCAAIMHIGREGEVVLARLSRSMATITIGEETLRLIGEGGYGIDTHTGDFTHHDRLLPGYLSYIRLTTNRHRLPAGPGRVLDAWLCFTVEEETVCVEVPLNYDVTFSYR